MKITKIFLFSLVLGAFAISSCQKQGCTDTSATNYDSSAAQDDGTCTYIPTITVIGDDTVTVAVGDTYNDAGASATNQDGTAVVVTTDASSVNTGMVGTYTVTYTAINAYGTATKTRTVKVVITQGSWTTKTWNITDDCSATQFPISSPATLAAGATSTDLEFSSFFTLVGGTATATISGNTITFPSQTISITGGSITLSGTGTMNNSGTEFVVNFSYDNTVPLLGGTGTCTATYTAQ